jgi:hypothetical protein
VTSASARSGVASQAGASVGRRGCGVLRLFAALERVIEREAVVACVTAIVGLVQRGPRGGVFGRGIALRTAARAAFDSRPGLSSISLWGGVLQATTRSAVSSHTALA